MFQLHQILRMLSERDICQFSMANKRTLDISYGNKLWAQLYYQRCKVPNTMLYIMDHPGPLRVRAKSGIRSVPKITFVLFLCLSSIYINLFQPALISVYFDIVGMNMCSCFIFVFFPSLSTLLWHLRTFLALYKSDLLLIPLF